MRNPFLRKKETQGRTPSIETSQHITSENITDKLDTTQFYVGYDFRVNDKITLRQPTLEKVVEMGDSAYYQMIHILTSISSDHISELWDSGVDFQKVSDIEFFFYMTRKLDKELSSLLFGDMVDFQCFEPYFRGEEKVLYDSQHDIIIDSKDCSRLSKTLCIWHGIKKEPVTAAGPMALRAMIEIDRQEKAEISKKKNKAPLMPMISSIINHEGFKYNLEDTMKLKIFFFMDCVSRIGLKVSTDRIATGFYTGSIDTKKFQPEKQLNWMRDLYE